MATSAQARIKQWIIQTLGNNVYQDKRERALRIVEEAIEVCQACEVNPAYIQRLIAHVYAKPVGEIRQEVGGVLFTALAMCENIGADYKVILQNEIERAYERGSIIAEKHNAKFKEGVSLQPAEPKGRSGS